MSESVTRPGLESLPRIDSLGTALNLFLTGFLVLFLELACIRWFAASVIFLQFFTNTILLASFVGMSCGLMAARHPRNWLALFPYIGLFTVLAALGLLAVYARSQGIAIDVGHEASSQELFFATEYRNPDVARFIVPIDLVVVVFFVLVAFMFVGLGQVLGRAFDAYPNRVIGYSLNIGGSLAGIVAFSLLSFLEVEPVLWFFVVAGGIAYLLSRSGQLSLFRALALIGLLLAIALPYLRERAEPGGGTIWSPYYAVRYSPWNRTVTINSIFGHQQIVPFSEGGAGYSLAYLLEQSAGGPPLNDVLIIGAGSGNDVDHALHHGVRRVDAVEIDPAVQKMGIKNNPDAPYSDPRVTSHVDDGRHFLRVTDRKYDLVVYGLVDSLILHSSYSNLRLESYLFTQEAFDDVKRVLKPGGVFAIYHYFRQGWVVERVAAMSERAFGCKPIVLGLPYRKILRPTDPAGFAVILSGCNARIAAAFSRTPNFWLHVAPYRNIGVNGFLIRPEAMPPVERNAWQQITPASIRHDAETVRPATDDWPFLYLRDRLIPDLSIRSMVELGLVGFAMVWLFLPKTVGTARVDGRMFFLGAAFMLLETKAVVQLALLFGGTWLVNSAVFFAALTLVLVANLIMLGFPRARLVWPYFGLFVLLLIAILVPIDTFLRGGALWRYVVPSLLALGPMFFSGVIFSRTFAVSCNPDWALGSNIAGSLLGGLSESFSMLVGFRYLLLLALAFYILSIVTRPQPRVSTA